MDPRIFETLCVSDLTVISGNRPSGRFVDHGTNGRKNNGILYIWDGAAVFRDGARAEVLANTGELIFIPKGKKYNMEYQHHLRHNMLQQHRQAHAMSVLLPQ